MSTLTFLTILDHPRKLQSMAKKLPLPLQDRWRREANKLRIARETSPAFSDFVKFVKTEAGIATDPVLSREALNRLHGSDTHNRSKPKASEDRARIKDYVYATTITPSSKREGSNPVSQCKLCYKDHTLDDCQVYLKKPLQERREFLKEKELCFPCYDPGHKSHGCAQRRSCKKCSRRHPTGLHHDNFRLNLVQTKHQNPSDHPTDDTVITDHVEMDEAVCNVVGTRNSVTAVPIVPVRLRAAESEVLTYAMLDSCSTGTFVLEDLVTSLDVRGVDTKLMVKTVNGSTLHDA